MRYFQPSAVVTSFATPGKVVVVVVSSIVVGASVTGVVVAAVLVELPAPHPTSAIPMTAQVARTHRDVITGQSFHRDAKGWRDSASPCHCSVDGQMGSYRRVECSSAYSRT